MMSAEKDPYERLLELFRGAPRLVGTGSAIELTSAGSATLLHGASVAQVPHALFDFWTDFSGGHPLQLRLLLASLLRSVELWRSIPAEGRVDRHVIEAFDRMFSAIHHDRARLHAELPADAEEAVREARLLHTEQLQRSSTPLPNMEMNWVTMSNSLVATWPSSFDRAMAPVIRYASDTWRSGLRHLACTAYSTADNPWSSEPCILWDRFGADEAVRWSDAQVARLEAELSIEHVEEHIKTIAKLANEHGADESRIVAAVCEEILVLQLEDVFPRRRHVLTQKLSTPSPGRFWILATQHQGHHFNKMGRSEQETKACFAKRIEVIYKLVIWMSNGKCPYPPEHFALPEWSASSR